MRSPNSGRIRFDFTPGIRKLLAAKKRYIYSIKNHVKQRRYVGISGQCRGRLSHHAWSFNHPEKAKTPLSRDAHEHPDHFSVGLVRALSENDDGQAAETAVIVGTDSLENGYNTRLGGGGGVCQPVSSQETTAFTIDHVVAKIRENFHPSKKRLLKIRADRLISPFTKNEATMKNAVYEFLFDPTGDKKDRIHHIGYTTTTLGKRMSAHFSCINNKESKGGRSISLYREIRAHPEQVKVRTFDIKSLTSEGIPLPMLERAFMKFFVERGEQVRNIKGGGKGSVSKAQ